MNSTLSLFVLLLSLFMRYNRRRDVIVSATKVRLQYCVLLISQFSDKIVASPNTSVSVVVICSYTLCMPLHSCDDALQPIRSLQRCWGPLCLCCSSGSSRVCCCTRPFCESSIKTTPLMPTSCSSPPLWESLSMSCESGVAP